MCIFRPGSGLNVSTLVRVLLPSLIFDLELAVITSEDTNVIHFESAAIVQTRNTVPLGMSFDSLLVSNIHSFMLLQCVLYHTLFSSRQDPRLAMRLGRQRSPQSPLEIDPSFPGNRNM
jgi:hypothetical protein